MIRLINIIKETNKMAKLPDFIDAIADAIFKKEYTYTSAKSFIIYDLPVEETNERICVEVTIKTKELN
jgi:hypothetical protein